MPDLSQPPLHTLPHAELLAKLRSLTNLRVIRDPGSPNGYRIDLGPFPGWQIVHNEGNPRNSRGTSEYQQPIVGVRDAPVTGCASPTGSGRREWLMGGHGNSPLAHQLPDAGPLPWVRARLRLDG